MPVGGVEQLERHARSRARALLTWLFTALGALLGSATICAQDFVGGSLAITNDYVYRGISFSRGHLAYQGGAHLNLPDRWQVGVWGSTLEGRDGSGTPVEGTGYVARTWTLSNDFSLRGDYTHYTYFGSITQFAYDYDEVSATLIYRSQLSVSASYLPNAARYRYQQRPLRSGVGAYDVAWVQPVWKGWSATVGVGYFDLADLYDTGYAYWHVGAIGTVGPFDLDLMYIDSDEHAAYIFGNLPTGARWTALLRWRF